MKLVCFSKPSDTISAQCKRMGTNSFELLYNWSTIENLGELVYPIDTPSPHQQEGLWEKTCLEFFIKKNSAPSYYEFNFSPNGNWNGYFFESYRSKPEILHLKPEILFLKNDSTLKVQFQMDGINIMQDEYSYLLCAVFVFKNHKQKFFSISHPKEKPDFHDPTHFIDF